MARWEPDSRGRLQQAALDLYAEHGYEQTTVAQIAARAGVTERTFFRHFADKREVLFARSGEMEELLAAHVAQAPADAAPLDAAVGALVAVGERIGERPEWGRRRARVLAASAELRERELTKLATLSATLADALRRRGTDEAAAVLAGEVAVAVFKTAFERWAQDDDGGPGLPARIHTGLAELRAVAAA